MKKWILISLPIGSLLEKLVQITGFLYYLAVYLHISFKHRNDKKGIHSLEICMEDLKCI